MPCFRGLEVCLVSLPGSTVIEEYPHPDASSLRLVTREEAAAAFTNELSLASSSHGSVQPSIPNLKADPKVSVYIASQPGKSLMHVFILMKMNLTMNGPQGSSSL
jgi:hypothetical protein